MFLSFPTETVLPARLLSTKVPRTLSACAARANPPCMHGAVAGARRGGALFPREASLFKYFPLPHAPLLEYEECAPFTGTRSPWHPPHSCRTCSDNPLLPLTRTFFFFPLKAFHWSALCFFFSPEPPPPKDVHYVDLNSSLRPSLGISPLPKNFFPPRAPPPPPRGTAHGTIYVFTPQPIRFFLMRKSTSPPFIEFSQNLLFECW